MKQDELKTNVIIMCVIAIVAAVARMLRFLEILNVGSVVTSLIFGVFVGSLIVVLKSGFVFLKNHEQRRGDSGKNLIVFLVITLVSLVLTCILATIIN